MYPGLIEGLAEKTNTRILLAVIDGVGDISIPELGGKTPLGAARTPELDKLATTGVLGLHIPIAPGITPGSGPAHLALFGYDPVETCIGRGLLSALGVGFKPGRGDLAARINFCTIDDNGIITDRRAGRISTEKCRELVRLLSMITIDGVEIFVLPVKEHRAAVVFRCEGLDEDVEDTDPGLTGRKPRIPGGSGRSSGIVREFIMQSGHILAEHRPANFLILRGFALHRELLSLTERFRLTPAVTALYPMYRGVASLVGMDLLPCAPPNLEGQVKAAGDALEKGHDFIFLHHKPADSAGEDGNIKAKIRAIEQFDAALPGLLDLGFDVVCVTGDHSTPCAMKLHSWHPVPVLISGGPERTGYSRAFTEREAQSGALGTFRAVDLMPLLLATAGKLGKFGA